MENKTVFICSPYRSELEDQVLRKREIEENLTLARRACHLAVCSGHVPLAPHLYFPQFLDDEKPEDRELGIKLGLAWLNKCHEIWVIGDHISEGMAMEIAKANDLRIPIVIQHIDREERESTS